MRKTRQELLNDLPEYIKSLGIISEDKTTGESLRIMLKNIIDSMTTDRETTPRGTIISWYGNVNQIPAGWHLCNGNGQGGSRTVETWQGPLEVPDLSGRFLVMYDFGNPHGYGDFQYIGYKSGDLHWALNERHLPPHKHRFPGDDSLNLNIGIPVPPSEFRIYNWDLDSTGKDRAQAGWYETTSVGNGTPLRVLPPYYTVAYLIYEGRPQLDYESGQPGKARVSATAYAHMFEATWDIDDLTNVSEVRCYLDDVLVARKVPEAVGWYTLGQPSVSGKTYKFYVETVNRDGAAVRSDIHYTVWYAPLTAVTNSISQAIWTTGISYTIYNYISLRSVSNWQITNIRNSELLVYQNSLNNLIKTIAVNYNSNGEATVNVGDFRIGNTYHFKVRNYGYDGSYVDSNIPNNTETSFPSTGGGSGSGSEQPYCPIEGSVVEMFDGSFKKIEDIKVGDEVLTVAIKSYKDNNTTEILKWGSSSLDYEYAKTIVESNEPHEVENTIRINDIIETSDSHIHLVKRNNFWKFVRATEVRILDLMRTKEGDIKVMSIENVTNKKTVYAIRLTKGSNTLFVDGILTHNAIEEKMDQ